MQYQGNCHIIMIKQFNSFRILFLKLLEFALTETWLKQLLFILEEKRKAQLIAASN